MTEDSNQERSTTVLQYIDFVKRKLEYESLNKRRSERKHQESVTL